MPKSAPVYWKNGPFPADLVNAVSWHHDPETCENHCTFSDIVHVANILGLMSGYGKGTNGAGDRAPIR